MERFIVIIAVSLIGCTVSGPQLIGKETYSQSSSVGFTGAAGARNDAIQSANRFCASMGKKVMLDYIESHNRSAAGGGEAEVRFLCFDENDPRFRTAILRSDKNSPVTINNNQISK